MSDNEGIPNGDVQAVIPLIPESCSSDSLQLSKSGSSTDDRFPSTASTDAFSLACSDDPPEVGSDSQPNPELSPGQGSEHDTSVEVPPERIETLLSSDVNEIVSSASISDEEPEVDGELTSSFTARGTLMSVYPDDSSGAAPVPPELTTEETAGTPEIEGPEITRHIRSRTIYDSNRLCESGRFTDSVDVSDRHYDPDRPRKVQFAEDIVQGYMPARVFERDCSVTKEELIAQYKKSCESLKTKVLPSIVDNLDKAKSFDDRIKELSLKGEKVDTKCCDALEIVLKNVQCITLDLENCYLEDAVAINLCEMIEFYETATKLKIGANNKLSEYAWMYICQLVRKCPFLEIMDCSNTELQEAAAILIARTIRNNCNLVSLNLQNCRMSGKYLNLLEVALRCNYILQELYLGDNVLNSNDAIFLSRILKSNFKLQCLDLRNNNLGDRGAALVFEGLREQSERGVGLISLVLWNNLLTSNCSYVIPALAANRSLETLNMGYNDLRNDGILRIKDGLMKNKNLVRFGVSNAKFDSVGAVALAEYIAESRCIIRLDLRNNHIKVAGIMALQNALKNNYTLTRLDLDEETKKESIQGYQELYRSNVEQIRFLLERNRTLAVDDETRKFVFSQQQASYRRGLAANSPDETVKDSNIPIVLPPKSDEDSSKSEEQSSEAPSSQTKGSGENEKAAHNFTNCQRPSSSRDSIPNE